jgi:lipopolysaccharide transport system ATP-binding protein
VDDSVIKVEGLYKKFCISQRKSVLYGGLDVFRSMIGFPQRRDMLRDKEIWALENINFEVKRGETLGVVGVNGAGKSTLLRVLSGIYPPDAGKISVKGSMGALIAAGAGFHPDMTGRENIYLNGAIIGLKKREIDRKLEEIIAFAELGEFIDTPVRFYSSGMYVRLGFSIAVNISPDILVIDEVLSVGDLTFQNKCFRKLKELRESVEAVVFVSHNLDHVRNVCGSVIVLESGKIAYSGDVEQGIIRYQAHTNDVRKRSADIEGRKSEILGSASFDADARLERIEIGSPREDIDGQICEGDDLIIKLGFTLKREILRPQFTIGIRDDRDIEVITQRDHDNRVHFDTLEPGSYQLKTVLKKPALVPGLYKVNFAVADADSCEVFAVHKKFASFVIRGNRFSRAIVNCDSVWELKKDQALASGTAQEKHDC